MIKKLRTLAKAKIEDLEFLIMEIEDLDNEELINGLLKSIDGLEIFIEETENLIKLGAE